MPTPDKSRATINQLSEEGYGDRRSIKKWLATDGVEAVGGLYDRRAAVRCLKGRKKSAAEANEDGEKGSILAEKTRQEVIKLTRENRIADKLEDGTYMLTDDVEKMILMGIGKFENIASKMESEFGWPPNVTKRLQQLLDEARGEMSKGLEGMGK